MKKKSLAKKKVNTFFREKRALAKRLVGTISREEWPRQMKYINIVFKVCHNNVDFINLLEKPDFFKDFNSFYWFSTENGQKWLTCKYNEFTFSQAREPTIKECETTTSQSVEIKKKKSIRDFLK
jgi:hypothetical protein